MKYIIIPKVSSEMNATLIAESSLSSSGNIKQNMMKNLRLSMYLPTSALDQDVT